MSLALDLGLPSESDLPEALQTEYQAALVAACTQLVRGGVTVPYSVWVTWTLNEREALAEAAERLQALRVTDAAVAAMGPEAMAAVRSRGDAGDAQLALVLSNQVGRIKAMAVTHARR